MFNKSCRWLDSNPGPLVSEATALPTASQPLPYSLSNSRTRKNELVKIREKNNFAFGTFFSLQCMSGVAETMQVTKAVGHWFDSRKGVFEVRGHRKTRFNILDPKFWQIH